MIESYIHKIFFVDDYFLEALEQKSIAAYKTFTNVELDTKVIKLPLVGSDANELVKYVHPSHIQVGNVLVKADYANQFLPVVEFASDYTLQKYQLWTRLCLALGAKSVRIIDVEDVNVEAEDAASIALDAAANTPFGGADVGFNAKRSHKNSEERKQIMDIMVQGAGSEADIVEAERILTKYNLFKDDMFNSIFELRKIKSNPLLKHQVDLDFSRDLKRVFDASMKARLKIMGQISEGQVELELIQKSLAKGRTTMKLSVVVEF